VYATNRQADAEAIVGILHEMTDDDREDTLEEGYCKLCINPLYKHGDSCPFRLSDEFIAKYGTHPPKEPRRA
jgi:hypothetical protein